MNYYFTIVALLAIITSTFAIPPSTSPSVRGEKWISVEGGTTWLEDYYSAGNATLSKRTGAQVISCYNSGTAATRSSSLSVIDDWCKRVRGQFVAPGSTIWSRYDYGGFTILVSAKALSNCGGFPIDDACNRLLRKPVNLCNSDGGEYGKQGGVQTDLCGQWRYDPGCNGSDV